MKFKLMIDPYAQEEVIAVVHAPSEFTQQIESLILSYNGRDTVVGYREDQMRKLRFSEIECITVLDRKVMAIDTKGQHYRLAERLRDLDNIQAFCAVRASIHLGAIHASIRRVFGRVFAVEESQIAHGRNAFAFRASVPLQQVEVVTAFCQNHRGGIFFPTPVAAHVGMRLMPVGDSFECLDSNQTTDSTAFNEFSCLHERRCVAKNVANESLTARLFLQGE